MTLSDAHSESGDLPPVEIREPSSGYSVKLPLFEGPLDLLLHLIRQNEVEIVDIPIAQIGVQYLAYIEMMEELNIDVAGEYLLMAATLALIKSRMLLPRELEGEGEGELDPRADLVTRLLEYQRYKEAAEALSGRRLLGRDVYRAESPGPEPTPEDQREIEVGLFDLLEAFRSALAAAPASDMLHAVETKEITVRERMLFVMSLFENAETVEFSQVFQGRDPQGPSRAMIVATFLAILELARLSALRLFQSLGDSGAPRGEIRLRGVPNTAGSGNWADRITDGM
ncbi:MAG: segregation/condensation protein A [Myxococcota bacterium]|nr:segregation/condensation protein A [Myxococcota bacterium]